MYANKEQGCQTVDPSIYEEKITGNLNSAAPKTKKENCYYVLKCDMGYLVSAGLSGIVRFCDRPTDKIIHRFRTEQSASNYLDRYERVLGKVGFGIRCVENGRLL